MHGICSVCVYKSVRRGVRVPWKVVDVSSKEVPEPWASRMVDRGFTDPRYSTDIPSLSRLAEACGMHTSTISSAIKGTGRKPSAATVVALTRVLGDDVAEWLGEERATAWEPPAESSLLTDRQRKAVEEIIRAMTERREDVRNDDRSAATNQAEVSSAESTSAGPSGMPGQHNVTQLPTAEALDPTLPDDVAARSEKGKGRAQEERERQDDEGEQ